MSQDQASSSVPLPKPIPKPRARARSDPTPLMPVVEGKPKPPVRSNSAEELTTNRLQETAFTTLSQPRFRPTGLDPRTFEEEDREESGYVVPYMYARQSIADDDYEAHADTSSTRRTVRTYRPHVLEAIPQPLHASSSTYMYSPLGSPTTPHSPELSSGAVLHDEEDPYFGASYDQPSSIHGLDFFTAATPQARAPLDREQVRQPSQLVKKSSGSSYLGRRLSSQYLSIDDAAFPTCEVEDSSGSSYLGRRLSSRYFSIDSHEVHADTSATRRRPTRIHHSSSASDLHVPEAAMFPAAAAGTMHTASPLQGTRVKQEALPELLNLLSPVAHSWDLFAQQIGVPPDQISQIKVATPQSGPSYLYRCFIQALAWWEANHDNPVYEIMIATLDPGIGKITPIMNRALASELGEFMVKQRGGVDRIIDEIEFVLTDEARSYEWTDGSFKLDTPHGALPAGAVPCRINVKASLTGQFQFPENSELVSPVYWISTPKNLRFSRPLTVHFQHCCTVEERDESDLSFVVAKCTQPDLPYKFKFLDGGCFVPNSSYGSISVTHFSGLAIVSKQRKRLSYCARTYVANKGGDRWRIHFVIVRDLDIVLKAVDAHYSFATRDVALRIVFKQSEISLDIPKKGKLIKKGWRIVPLSYPSISKRDADDFRVGQWIPECELIVEWEKRRKRPVRLRHQVPLIGAKAPKDYFIIAIDPEWEEKKVEPLPLKYPKPDLRERYPAGLEDKPELYDLMNEVAAKIPSKWRQIGIELRLTPDELDSFSLATLGDALRCFSSVFTLWQKRMSREPYSWLTVVESLKALAVGEHKLALELSEKLLTRTWTC